MSMVKRQVWIADDNKFDHIVKNSQRMLRLNDQYENHRYVEEFTKECKVILVYNACVLEVEVDAKFSLGDIWNLFQGDTLPNNASNFCRQMIHCMKAWNYIQKTLDLPLNTKIIRQKHRIMMEDKKDVLAGEYRKSPAFAGYHTVAPGGHFERYMEDAIFKFFMAATNLFGNFIKIHPFEDGNRRICRLIMAHVLIQMKCCLFPVILSSFP